MGSQVVRKDRPASERVIVNAPMSFAGAAQRTGRLAGTVTRWEPVWAATTVKWLVVWPALLALLAGWWATIVVWYVAFGLLLVPYRLLRRGSRKRRQEALRHREVMAALEDKR